MDVASFRRARTGPLRRFEVIAGVDQWLGDRTYDTAMEIMGSGWKLADHPRVPLNPPVDWGAADANRSWAFHLHAWDFLGPALASYDNAIEPTCLDWAAEVAADWSDQHRAIDLDRGMAWYDMSVALRGHRLAYVADAAARSVMIDDATVGALLRAIDLHFDAYADDSLFRGHSNHGFYFAAGQLAVARRLDNLPDAAGHEAQARERLHTMIATQFTAEGVHREHSPDYHRMVLQALDGLIAAGLLDEAEFGPLARRIGDALAWFVLPNGRIAMFGDSPHTLVVDEGLT